MAKGLRCTTHRIFLASLILSAKYLNDSSPKNKHWATYSVISTDVYSFGFSRTEVNLMEKQLLFLLDWDLRISEEDLYRELDVFLAPIRQEIDERHLRRQKRKAEERAARRRREEAEAWIAAAAATSRSYPSPPASRGNSRSRSSVRDISPPGLTYSASHSSTSSYASSAASSSPSHMDSAATTPLSNLDDMETYHSDMGTISSTCLYDSPVEIVVDRKALPSRKGSGGSLLPYEISAEELRDMQDGGNRVKRMRGVFGRVFGSTNGVSVRS
jgi:hypothetical protein